MQVSNTQVFDATQVIQTLRACIDRIENQDKDMLALGDVVTKALDVIKSLQLRIETLERRTTN